MKSYCSRNNNLVAMGWFLVILGLVITSGVDGGSLSNLFEQLAAEMKNTWFNGILEEAKHESAFEKFIVDNKELIRGIIDPRNVHDFCTAVKELEEEHSAERSGYPTIPDYETFLRIYNSDKSVCDKINSPPTPSVRN